MNNTLITLWASGSYSHQTATHILPQNSQIEIELIHPCETLIQQIRATAGSLISGSLWNMSVIEKIPQSLAGVVPLHNTYGRTVNLMPEALYALTRQQSSIQVIGWYHLQVKHILAWLPGAKIENISSIHSHPQALSQCIDAWLKRFWDHINLQHETSTTAHIPHLTQSSAVICSEAAALKNNLEILDKNFWPKDNITDFAIVSTNPNCHPEMFQNLTKNKTLAVITLKNKEKSLANALDILWNHWVDMSSIHSQMSKPGEINFIIVANNHIYWDGVEEDLQKVQWSIQIL